MNFVDLDFMKTFLLTYQSFTTPGALLLKLIERYHVPWNVKDGMPFDEFDKMRLKVQLRVCNVLQQWVKKFSFDFVDNKDSQPAANTIADEKTIYAGVPISSKEMLRTLVLRFAENTLLMDHPNLARQLRKHIFKLVSILSVVT